MVASLFYVTGKPSAFSSLAKLQATFKQVKGKISNRETQAWLEQQAAYTFHKPARKRFPSNPFTVSNVMEVWESDLLYVQNISKYSDNIKYLLTMFDVFSKFFHVVPQQFKIGPAFM